MGNNQIYKYKQYTLSTYCKPDKQLFRHVSDYRWGRFNAATGDDLAPPLICRCRSHDAALTSHGPYLHLESHPYLSLVMRKPAFCICENKDADQLHSNCAADNRLCFRYMNSTILDCLPSLNYIFFLQSKIFDQASDLLNVFFLTRMNLTL